MAKWSYDNVSIVHIELTNLCNAACPVCARYINHSEVLNPELDLRSITFQEFKEWFPLDFVNRSNRWTFCGTNGDPLMARDLLDIIRYVAENSSAAIQINTNGGIRSPEFFVELGNILKSQTNRYVIFSVDGLEDTNHIYRRNVKWNKVYENMKAYGSTGAESQWDFLVFKHNEHQIEEARQLSKDLGIKFFAAKRAFGFENGMYYSDLKVYGKNLEYVYSIEPPDNVEYRNHKFNLKKSKDVWLIDPASIKKKTQEQYKIDWQQKIDRELADYKFPEHLKNKTIQCKSQENEKIGFEIYVDATGNVFPCCYVGTWYNGSYESPASLQIRKEIYEYGVENISLHHNSLAEILNSEYLNKCFTSKWDGDSEDSSKLEFCFFNCGGDAGVDRIYNKDVDNVFRKL